MKRLIFTIAFTLLIFGLCGCSAQPHSAPAAEPELSQTPLLESQKFAASPNFSLEALPTPLIERPYSRPSSLMVLTEYSEYGFFPHVVSAGNSDLFNDSIHALIGSASTELNRPVFVEYSVETNESDILSLLLHFYDMETGILCGIYSITFDARSGKVCTLPDYFDDEDGRWRRVLPDIITQQAEKQGITLLSDLLPINDDQNFYISGTNLVLFYRPYEIATYEAGIPQFSIPISDLTELLREDSPLLSLLKQISE